jgi:flagellar biosynthesis protein FlhF
MRLKTFEADNMNDALRLVREVLGDDAVILSSSRSPSGKGITVTAGVDAPEEDGIIAMNRGRMDGAIREIDKILEYHGVPQFLSDKITDTCRLIEFIDISSALEKSLSLLFSFAPLELDTNKSLMMVGPPGSGKTITTAKIAAQAVMSGLSPNIITLDTRRAGGVEQLKAFTDILELPLNICESPDEFAEVFQVGALNIIDSFGGNPYDYDELRELAAYVDQADIEPVLVNPAGLDVSEAADIASAFGFVGVKRLIVTRTANAKRFGGILASTNSAGMALAGYSGDSRVSEAFVPFNVQRLAALLLKYRS